MSPQKFDVKWVERDTRSYKKLIPAILEHPESIIVTVDDDAIYSHSWLENLWRAHLLWPQAVIGTRGYEVTLGPDGRIRPYGEWVESRQGAPSNSTLLTGVGGILYPPNSIPRETLQPELFLEACPTADDIWFKCAALSKGTYALVTSGGQYFITIPGTQEDGLWHVNATKAKNDDQLKKAMSILSLSPAHFTS